MDSGHGIDGGRELHGEKAMGSRTTTGVSGAEGGEAARAREEAAGSGASSRMLGVCGWLPPRPWHR